VTSVLLFAVVPNPSSISQTDCIACAIRPTLRRSKLLLDILQFSSFLTFQLFNHSTYLSFTFLCVCEPSWPPSLHHSTFIVLLFCSSNNHPGSPWLTHQAKKGRPQVDYLSFQTYHCDLLCYPTTVVLPSSAEASAKEDCSIVLRFPPLSTFQPVDFSTLPHLHHSIFLVRYSAVPTPFLPTPDFRLQTISSLLNFTLY
jgi:hypothetical protein